MPDPEITTSLFDHHFGAYRLGFYILRAFFRSFRQRPEPAQETRWTFYNNEEPNRI